MNVHLLWLLGALVALTATAVALRQRRPATSTGLDKPWPLAPKGALLSEAEQRAL